MDDIITKVCSKCKREFPLTTFYFHKGSSKDGFKCQCKECRGFKFGETKKCNRINSFWDEEKNNILIKLHPNMTDLEISKILNTTEAAINAQARRLKLTKDLWWTEDEINCLKEFYPSMSSECFQDRYMPNRTLASINKKSHDLNIFKNEDIFIEIHKINLGGYANKGKDNLHYKGIKDLYAMCRNNLGKWIEEIQKTYDYKCYFTNKNYNLVVHHINPFKNIFNEVLKDYINQFNFPIYENIEQYYENNQNELLINFVDNVVLKHKVEDGILITKDIHTLFHNLYGTRYCSRLDFKEFKNNIETGKISVF